MSDAPAWNFPSRGGPLYDPVRTWWGAMLLAGVALFVYFAAQIAAVVVLVGLFIGEKGGQFEAATFEAWIVPWLPAIIFASTVAIGLLVLLLAKLDGLPELPPPTSTKRTAVVVVLCALACVLGQALIGWLQARAGFQPTEQQALVAGLQQTAWPLLVLALVVLAPLSEELLFRRLGYGALARPWGRPAAALVTMAVFAVIHLNASGTFLYVWLALCCTVAYEKTGRTAAPIAVHAANNSLAVVSLLAAR